MQVCCAIPPNSSTTPHNNKPPSSITQGIYLMSRPFPSPPAGHQIRSTHRQRLRFSPPPITPHLPRHTRPCKPPQSNKHTPNQPINPVNPRPQSIVPKKSNTRQSSKQKHPSTARPSFRQSRPLFFPREQNYLFKIPFLSFSIPSSSMSLPASAVPCLLPSSPQPSHTPSHAHTHPLQIFFPSEITQKLLQNKATSVKILFLGHSRNETLQPQKSPISRPRASFQRRATRPDSQTKTASIQPHFTFVNPDHSFSPGSKTTFSKYPFFLFQFQAHPCPSLPPPCPACCRPAL